MGLKELLKELFGMLENPVNILKEDEQITREITAHQMASREIKESPENEEVDPKDREIKNLKARLAAAEEGNSRIVRQYLDYIRTAQRESTEAFQMQQRMRQLFFSIGDYVFTQKYNNQ